MFKQKIKKNYNLLFLIILLVFFPFPSKKIGYTLALYISDAIFIFSIIYLILKNKTKIIITQTLCNIFFLLGISIFGIIISYINGYESNLRQLAEIFRTIEWMIIYVFLYDYFYKNYLDSIKFENNFKKIILIVIIIITPIVIIELFNLPLKNVLRSIYEMSKSGHIYSYYNRIVGTLRNPNMFGIWLCMITIGIYLFKYKLIIKAPIFILCIGMIYFTGSRTSIITLIIILIIISIAEQIFNRNNKKKVKQILLLLILIATISMVIGNKLLYSIRINKIKDSFSDFGGRINIWNNLQDDIKDNLIFGNGIVKDENKIYDNLYVKYLYTYGIIGLTFLVYFLLKNLFYSIKCYFTNGKKDIYLFLIAIQLIFLIAGWTIQILDVLQITFLYFISITYVDITLIQGNNHEEHVEIIKKKGEK